MTIFTPFHDWLEDFFRFKNYESEYYKNYDSKYYNNLNVKEKIDLLVKNEILSFDWGDRSVPTIVCEKFIDTFCRDVFEYIYWDVTFDYEKFTTNLRLQVSSLDKKDKLEVVNLRIREVNQGISSYHNLLFSKCSIDLLNYENNLKELHMIFWSDRISRREKLEFILKYILLDETEKIYTDGFGDFIRRSDFYVSFSILMEDLLHLSYLKQIKEYILNAQNDEDLENLGCTITDNEWLQNDFPSLFSDYGFNLFYYIVFEYDDNKTPSFYSYLYYYLSVELFTREYKELLTVNKPAKYIKFVNQYCNAGLKSKIIDGTINKREEFYDVFGEYEKKFRARFVL